MSEKRGSHSSLLQAAARNVLQPLGLIQKGRSRIWVADHGWWVCVVEFQPSSWAPGSYLNVGCMWLWHAKDHISFDEGYRVEPFANFSNDEQFAAVANFLANKAADELHRYRKLFRTVHDVCAYYSRHRPDGFWPTFNAATSSALAGKAEQAKCLFSKITQAESDDQPWLVKARAEASKLCAVAGDIGHFRALVIETIQYARQLHKLPVLSSVVFD